MKPDKTSETRLSREGVLLQQYICQVRHSPEVPLRRRKVERRCERCRQRIDRQALARGVGVDGLEGGRLAGENRGGRGGEDRSGCQPPGQDDQGGQGDEDGEGEEREEGEVGALQKGLRGAAFAS